MGEPQAAFSDAIAEDLLPCYTECNIRKRRKRANAAYSVCSPICMKRIEALLSGIDNCACGKKHSCPIDMVYIGKDALGRLAGLCAPYHRILLVADENTWDVCGRAAYETIRDRAQALVLSGGEHVLVPDEAAIAKIEDRLPEGADLIVGVGSGVINDLCKHVSFTHGLPYAIAATAPSMDGYASVGAALILGGMKVTLNARPPMAIIADTRVLAGAPMEMIKSGWGDIVGKYSCLNDWKLSRLLRGEYFCQTVYDLVMETARRVEALASGVAAREEEAVAQLMEALVVVGIAMSYVGNSRPASGSEHHLSHYFEITGILNGTPYYPHGTDVLYASVVTARLREMLRASGPQRQAFDWAAWEREIRRIYTSSADGVIALQEKTGWHHQDDSETVTEKWNEICAVLAEAPDEAQMLAMLRAIGFDMAEFNALYGSDVISDGIRYAKELKDRYSVLWLFEGYHAPVRWA